MNHAAGETALVDGLEVHMHIVGEGLFAPPTTMGWTNRWYSSTNPPLIAPARSVRDLPR
jgi:hypothetical protein